MRYLQTKRKKKAIYSDSKIALSWVRQGKCRSTLRVVQPKLAVWKAVDEAEAWLKRYGVPFTLLKWKTEDLGEIPADFGRK
jgi:ribonuclease HI